MLRRRLTDEQSGEPNLGDNAGSSTHAHRLLAKPCRGCGSTTHSVAECPQLPTAHCVDCLGTHKEGEECPLRIRENNGSGTSPKHPGSSNAPADTVEVEETSAEYEAIIAERDATIAERDATIASLQEDLRKS